MTDCTFKELVRSFDFSDFHSDRTMYKEEVINGRTYYKSGTYTATSIVGDLYKVIEPSNESFKYVLLIGVARQHPCDVKIDYTTGIEIAAINAKTNPVAQMCFPSEIDWDIFRNIANTYIASIPPQFIKTIEEIKAQGLDADKYMR